MSLVVVGCEEAEDEVPGPGLIDPFIGSSAGGGSWAVV
jgi:hypothetical protein